MNKNSKAVIQFPEEKDKDAERNLYLKRNELYQYLQSHKNSYVQRLRLLYLVHSKNKKSIDEDKIFIVGLQGQIMNAIENLKNYNPQQTILLLQNSDNVKIFDSNYSEIKDPISLYTSDVKVTIDFKPIKAKNMKSKIIDDFNSDESFSIYI